jgi:tRNA threonylcarbamoyladenosine biosynthesis protein TsaB
MLILALDTTTRVSSCAVARDGVVIREEAGDPSRPQAERLPGDLMSLLEHAGIGLPDIDVFAVATGPGSFTGLRIGIATMQGLAFAAGKPLVGVSGFDALATAAGSARVATWVDAWRGEVYAALYDGREVVAPIVMQPEPLLADIRARYGESAFPVTFIGDGAGSYRDLIERTLGEGATIADPVSPVLAGAIAQMASDIGRTELPPPHTIRPLYVRRPDAELARAQKHR